MISAHDRADLTHIVRTSRLILVEADPAHPIFSEQVTGGADEASAPVIEDTPSVAIRKSGLSISEVVKSVDDLQISLEDRPY